MNETPIDLAFLESPLLLAQLVCTRLTDDVGSLLARSRAGSGMTGRSDPPAAIADLDPLVQRIALLRACWGTATPRLTARRLALLAEGLPQGIRAVRRLRLDTSGLPSRTALSVP